VSICGVDSACLAFRWKEGRKCSVLTGYLGAKYKHQFCWVCLEPKGVHLVECSVYGTPIAWRQFRR